MKSQIKKLEISYFLICLKKRHISLCSRAADMLLFSYPKCPYFTSNSLQDKLQRRESIFYNAKLQNVSEHLRK